jgi:hypothetical protein
MRALRAASLAHSAQGPLRFLCLRARIWRAGLDERIWQSGNASGPLLARREARFLPEFGSFARGDVIAKMSELRRKGVPRSDFKIIASDPDLAAITKDVEALNDA